MALKKPAPCQTQYSETSGTHHQFMLDLFGEIVQREQGVLHGRKPRDESQAHPGRRVVCRAHVTAQSPEHAGPEGSRDMVLVRRWGMSRDHVTAAGCGTSSGPKSRDVLLV